MSYAAKSPGLIAVAAAIAACAGGWAAAQPDPGERGRKLVEISCAGCHATGASGASRDVAAPPFRHLNRRYPGDALEKAVQAGILTGHPMMPAFAFGPDDIKAIVAYLKSVQSRQAA